MFAPSATRLATTNGGWMGLPGIGMCTIVKDCTVALSATSTSWVVGFPVAGQEPRGGTYTGAPGSEHCPVNFPSFNWVRKSGNRCSIVLRKNKENRDKVMKVYTYSLTYMCNVLPSPYLTKHKITHMYKPLGDNNKHHSEASWLQKRTVAD